MNQEKAFLEAFDQYADSLYRHCYFRISDPEIAKDLVSEAYTRTWDYLAKGKKVLKFRPFLYRTLNHLIIDEYRKKTVESLDVLLYEQDVPESAFSELVGDGKDEIEIELDSKRVPELLAKMPVMYRDVVVMRYIDGLAPAEISKLVGHPVNTVSVRIHRGMAWLSKKAKEKKL